MIPIKLGKIIRKEGNEAEFHWYSVAGLLNYVKKTLRSSWDS